MRAIQKITKILHMKRDTRKTLKRGKIEKWKVWEKFDNVTTTIKFFTFFFAYGKWCILLENIVWENVVYNYYISNKRFF